MTLPPDARSTYVAFERHGYAWEMIGWRAGLGFLIACTTGLVVHLSERKHGAAKLLKLRQSPWLSGFGGCPETSEM